MGIAQISIAFVGFAAIVEVVRDRTQTERSQFENMLARTMIEFGFSALLLALLPLLVSRFSEALFARVWGVLAGVGSVALIAHIAAYTSVDAVSANQTF
jgi:hypothetical protein